MNPSVPQEVLDYFIDELPAEQAGEVRDRLVGDPGASGQVLDALLTVREPAPIPGGITERLDELLAARAASLPRQDAEVLEPCGDSGFAWHLVIWRGDLTRLAADVIVNAANSRMLGCFIPGHACIDNAIHRVAGPALRLACHEHIRARGHPEPTGTATLTPGYHLPARFVAHTVGPVVEADAPSERDAGLLASCYRSILDACHGRGLSTVGFCAISTGVFGYPKRDAAVVALTTIRDWLAGHPGTTVRPIVSAFTETDLAIHREALTEVDR